MPDNITKFPVPYSKSAPKPKRKTPKRPCARLDLGINPDTGARVRKSFYGKTKKEASAKRDAYINTHYNTAAGDPSQPLSVWIEKWYSTYGNKSGYSANTTKRIDCDKLIAGIGELPLEKVREIDIQQFADSVSRYAKTTVKKIRATTNAIFDRAVSNRLITINPATYVKWADSGEGTHRYLDRDEIQTIADNYTKHRVGIWAMLMLFAGLRRGEALALTWDDVDLDNSIVHVRHAVHFEVNEPVIGKTKNKSSVRDIPMLPMLRDALLREPRTSEYICHGAANQLVTQSIWQRSWDSYNLTMENILNGDVNTKTGEPVIPGKRTDRNTSERLSFLIRAHDLRHTYASMLYDAGVDLLTAQKLLGHSSSEVTLKIYTHLSEIRKKQSTSALENYVEKTYGRQKGIKKRYKLVK